ncbi:acid protease [Coniochaeta sp. PMI_546]|nr:acid protease [Coniochaeta sp. PMI_546]
MFSAFRGIVIAAWVVASIRLGSAQTSCSNTTFAISLRNCTFASGVISWGNLVEVGTPPQRLCLVPSTVINSTLVSQQSLCVVSNTLEPHKCEALRGGFFNENSSTTWTDVSLSNYNDTRSNPTWEHFNAPGFTKVGYDKINFPNTNVALYGAGIALNQYGNNSNAGMIGLGKDSVFLNDAVRQGRAGSKSWALDAGSQSLVKARNGELVIGGYNAGRTDGSFSWSNVSNMAGDRPCPLRTKITHMTVTLSNGDVIPIQSNAEVVEACIEPYDNLFRFTPGMLLNWKQITGFNETLLQVYANEEANNLSFTELGLPYDSSRVGDWSLSITLDSGYTTTLPAYELQRPLLGFDNLGNKQAVPGITNLQILNVPTGAGEVPTLGKIFLSRSYLAVNYETSQFGLALAAVDPQPNSYVPLGCNSAANGTSGNGTTGGGGTGTTSGSSVPLGAIIGGAVGGGALLVFAIALFCWTRHKKRKQALANSGYPSQAASPGMSHAEYPPGVYLESHQSPNWPNKYVDQYRHNSLQSGASRYGVEAPGSPYSDPGHSSNWPANAAGPAHRGLYEVPG